MPGKELAPRPAAYAAVPSMAPPWPQQSGRQSEAAIKTIGRWARRNSHLTVPLVIPPVLWLIGLMLYRTYLAGYAAFAGIILAVAVCYFAPHKWDRKPEVWYARLSVILAVSWLIAASVTGPLSGEVTGIILASTLFAGGVAWGFFWWRHKRPRGQRKRARLVAECDAWWQSHCWTWNLAGSQVTDAKLSGVTLWMRIQGLAGRHSYQQFEQALHLIESAAEGHADIGLVRIARVKGHPSQVDLFLKQENPLRETVEYDMSVAPQSVHEPASLGMAETGSHKMTSQRKNRFVIGATRTGKSNDLLVGLANLSGCRDGRAVLIDLKGGRSARPVLKGAAAEYVITELDEARMFLRMTTAECLARAKYAYDGNEQLAATEDVPALFTLVDEVHGLTSVMNGDAECSALLATLASQGSGLELYLWVYTQFGSLEESVRTEQTRGNLALRICYRVEEARHGQYVIPEYAKLDASKLEEQGTCYVKDGPRTFPEQVRAPKMAHDLFFRVAASNAQVTAGLPPLGLYCGSQVAYRAGGRDVTWGEWWDTRWLRLDEAFRADSPQYQAAIADHPHAAAAVTAEAQQAAAPVPSPAPGAGDAAQAAARIAADDADLMARVPDDFRPDPALVARLPQVIASQEDRFAETLQGATADSPATPKSLMQASGRSSSWVHDRISALAEIGHVTQVSRGQYVPVPGMDVRRGLAEIKARNERLAREARQMVNAA